MSGWLRSPESLPSYFARDTEPRAFVRPPPAGRKPEHGPATGLREEIRRRVAEEARRRKRCSTAGW